MLLSNRMQIMQYIAARCLIFASLFVCFNGCMPVPQLISTESVKARYIGQHESTLISEHGLPDQTATQPDGSKICTWIVGTTSTSSGVHYGYGVYGGATSGSQQKLTAYIDPDGTVKDLKTNGYSLGNEDAVNRAKQTNAYLGFIYGVGIFSFIISLAII